MISFPASLQPAPLRPMHPLAFSPVARRRARGSTLVVAVFVVALLASFIGLAVDYTANTGLAMRRARDLTTAQTLANGALETLYQNWYQWVSTHQAQSIPITPSASSYTAKGSIQSIAAALQSPLNTAMASNNFTLASLTLVPVDRTDAPVPISHFAATLSVRAAPVRAPAPRAR